MPAPYKSAGEYTLWQGYRKYARLRKEYTNLPIHETDSYISVHPDKHSTGPGSVRLIASDKAASIKGKKQDSHEDYSGFLIVDLDEVSEFQNATITKALANLLSQPNLRVRTSTNFDEFQGLIDYFYEPKQGDWTTLDRQTSHRWMSVGNGLVLRFQAKRSPNMTAGVNYYPYLLGDLEHNDILAFGEDSKEYLSQGDAFPAGVPNERRIITKADFKDGGAFKEASLANIEKFAFLDPAFTQGGDAAILYPMDYGYSSRKDTWQIQPKKPHQIKIQAKKVWEDEDIRVAVILRGTKGMREGDIKGAEMSSYAQLAVGVYKYIYKHGILLNNLAYDESLDGKLGSEFQYYLGDGVTPYTYGGKPDNRLAFPPVWKWKGEGRDRHKTRKRNDEISRKMVSQMYFTAAGLIRGGYVIGMKETDIAVTEAVNRYKDEKSGAGGYQDVETKKEYKSRNKQKSPDYADSLFGGFAIIVERRLQPKMDVAKASSRGEGILGR